MAPRRCIVVRGTRTQTRRGVERSLAAIDPSEIVWVAPDAPDAVRVSSGRTLDALLGQSADAVVLDLHGALDPDIVATAEGLVRRGGALVLRMNAHDVPHPRRADFAIAGFSLEEVGTRFAERFDRMLPALDETPLVLPLRMTPNLAEQDALVDELSARLVGEQASITLLLADRGRGKSSAIGRAIARASELSPSLRVIVTAAHEASTRELFRFERTQRARFATPDALDDADVIVIDEAAQLPIGLTKRIVLAHPRARIVLSTTCRGYEGSGRGLALRLTPWLRTLGRPLHERTLVGPIRWEADDPLERWVFDTLLLDAEPAPPRTGPITHAKLEREALANDERTLRQVFGLLVLAHYRTTPTDLARLLDAPNLDVHVLREGDVVVAASLVAREGSLDASALASLDRGERIRGHALLDTLTSHTATREALTLAMVRSMRVVVHPERRRRGLARRLVDAVHASYAPDLFGTMFGATAELVTFRRALGYEVVRVGTASGARSGEPAVVMVRPVSPRAFALVDRWRVDLARELPAQLEAMASDGTSIDERLRATLVDGLPTPLRHDATSLHELTLRYVGGTQPADVVIGSLGELARIHELALATLRARDRALIRARLIERRSWAESGMRSGLPSVAAAMRAMREAVRALLDAIDRR
jgi:tRNA(Met) cytidine acetyltransferase